MDEQQKLQQRRQEDLRFVQAVWCVGIALVLEFLLFQVRDRYFNLLSTPEAVNVALFIESALLWTRIGSLWTFLGGIAWLLYSIHQGKSSIFPQMCLIFLSMLLGATAHGVLLYGSHGLNTLLMLVPAWAGLGLVFFLYQIEFFIAAFFTSLGGIGLWIYQQMPTVMAGSPLEQKQITFYVFLNFSLIVILGGFYLVNRAFRNQGSLEVRGRTYTLISDMKDGSSLWLVGLSGLVSLLSLALGLGFGHGLAYYLIFGLMAWLFVLLIYFTVKMM